MGNRTMSRSLCGLMLFEIAMHSSVVGFLGHRGDFGSVCIESSILTVQAGIRLERASDFMESTAFHRLPMGRALRQGTVYRFPHFSREVETALRGTERFHCCAARLGLESDVVGSSVGQVPLQVSDGV